MGRLMWIVAASAAAALLTAGATAATGDRDGLALLDRVHRAYAHVPAVLVSGRTGQLQFRFTLVLDSGVTVGEEFFAESPSGVTQLVYSRGGPTYAHNPGTSCWRALSRSDPQAFQNVGLPFPDQGGMRVGTPRAVSDGWLLPLTAGGDPGTFAVDKAGRVGSITVVTGGRRIFEHVAALRSAPTLASPDPHC
jgi:hypothetical protein